MWCKWRPLVLAGPSFREIHLHFRIWQGKLLRDWVMPVKVFLQLLLMPDSRMTHQGRCPSRKKSESGTSQSKSGTSVDLSNSEFPRIAVCAARGSTVPGTGLRAPNVHGGATPSARSSFRCEDTPIFMQGLHGSLGQNLSCMCLIRRTI